MKPLKNFIYIGIILILQFFFAYGGQIELKRKLIEIDEKDEGFFTAIADWDIYKDYLFLVDNPLHHVLRFKIKENKVEFLGIIGRYGRNPGELELPISAVTWNDTIAIKDEFGISFFDINGKYKKRFRYFSPCISLLFINDNIYTARSNPLQSDLIEVHSMDGKELFSFGKKFIDLDYSFKMFSSPYLYDYFVFDGLLISDGRYIYYISRRFGKLIKFTLSGETVLEKNITSFFGKDGRMKEQENTRLFLKKEFGLEKMVGVPQYYIFRDAKVNGRNIYLLNDANNFSKKEKNSYIEIICIDKNSFKVVSIYRSPLLKEEYIDYLAVMDSQNGPVFWVVLTTNRGSEIFKLESINNARN